MREDVTITATLCSQALVSSEKNLELTGVTMNPFKNVTEISNSLSGFLQGAHSLMDKAGGEGFGQGFKGVLQEALDLNIESFTQTVDSHMGVAVMRLTLAGDQEGVQTALRFRNYAIMRIEEMQAMRDVANDIILLAGTDNDAAVHRMTEFLDGREPEMACSTREEGLKQEIGRLKKMVKQMSTFLDDEEKLLENDGSETAEDETVEEGPSKILSAALRRPSARLVIGNQKQIKR